ncbi:MAG: hypothetical protein QF515_11670 [Pseudomonadales bacterium]|nr:hypothetical protein [Pseudomonadales bacterium]MDP6827748.1 hypothetical protein [Pseudomonadales bacterium]
MTCIAVAAPEDIWEIFAGDKDYGVRVHENTIDYEAPLTRGESALLLGALLTLAASIASFMAL